MWYAEWCSQSSPCAASMLCACNSRRAGRKSRQEFSKLFQLSDKRTTERLSPRLETRSCAKHEQNKRHTTPKSERVHAHTERQTIEHLVVFTVKHLELLI